MLKDNPNVIAVKIMYKLYSAFKTSVSQRGKELKDFCPILSEKTVLHNIASRKQMRPPLQASVSGRSIVVTIFRLKELQPCSGAMECGRKGPAEGSPPSGQHGTTLLGQLLMANIFLGKDHVCVFSSLET